ncbi:MAG: exodeoxyribonuclease VII large subunit [Oscillospiraceae bacterium]|nr:exodeoxyribonuclease VII large subunit [Oscillospiraceae bacterium]
MAALLTITVSQLNRYARSLLEEDDKLRDLYVKGEVAGFVRHGGSGHCYFRLADAESSIKAVIFRQNADLLGFQPEDGMAVLARCSLGVYERDGVYQLYVSELMPSGEGAKSVALAQRKRKLEAMGVFDPAGKKSLPRYPIRVGLVTSAAGAALQDIITAFERRWPVAALVLCPALVQGEEAPASIRAALEQADGAGCDLLILSRGGGSKEDLSAFGDEGVVLAVYRAQTPIISAVGHQTDHTLCDYAADARAATPTAAAELATPDKEELLRRLAGIENALRKASERLLAEKHAALAAISTHPGIRSPKNILNKCKEKLDIHREILYNSSRIIIQSRRARLSERAARLDALSPLKVLERGYCIAAKHSQVASAVGLNKGDDLNLRFHDGSAVAKVLDTSPDKG